MQALEGHWLTISSNTSIRVNRGMNLRDLVFSPGTIVNSLLMDRWPPHVPVKQVDVREMAKAEQEKAGTIVLQRDGELGDVVATYMAARVLGQVFAPAKCFLMIKNPHYREYVRALDGNVRVTDVRCGGVIVDFRGYFEIDHRPKAVKCSRLQRVLWTFGVDA